MIEYVVELSDPHRDENGDVECIYEQRERVIRCQDCKYFDVVENSPIDFAGFDDNDAGEWCDLTNTRACDDGFCAWAKPREEEQDAS